MTGKQRSSSLTRGWLPQQPTHGVIKSNEFSKNQSRWAAIPFLGASGLMAVASVLSAFVGVSIVASISPFQPPPGSVSMFSYSNIYVEIVGLATFVLGSYSAILLLSRKRINSAVAGIVIVVSLWLTTPIAHALENIDWEIYLLAAWPLIALPISALILTAINNFLSRNKSTFPKEPPTIRKSLVIILGVTGTGLTLLSIANGVLTFFQFHIIAVTFLLIGPAVITGVSFLVTAYLVRRTYKH
jgi:hypothetical protein